MAFAYPTVMIGGQPYMVLASLPVARVYLAADPAATAWAAGDDEAQSKWLVAATRAFGRQLWKGEAVDVLAFPRTGIPGVDPTTIPPQIITGTIELAKAIAEGFDLNATSTAGGVRRQKAGSVEIEYFAGAALAGTRFPLPVWELVGSLTGNSGLGHGIGGSYSSGTCGRAPLDQDFSVLGSGDAEPWQRNCE